MIPRTFPSTFAANGQQQMVVYSLPSITGLTAWIDYIPVKGVTTESATLENTYANGGYQAVDSLASLTGKQAWLDYIPVYEDASYTKPWSTDAGGYIPTSALAALLLDFTSGRLDPRITFSRTTNATLTNSAGLVANAPMNLLTFSEQFDNGAWVKSGATITANTVVAPDGTLTADKLVENTATGLHNARQTATVTNISYAYSVYIKPAGRNFAAIECSGQFVYFDLVNGTIGFQNNATGAIQSVGNGWYRCTIIFTPSAGTPSFLVYPSTTAASGGVSYTGDGISGLFIWGAQLELGSTATTYNPTTVKNLLGFTENFDNAAWTKSNATISATKVDDIYGQPFAQQVTSSASNGTVLSTYTAVASTPYTFNIWMKRVTGTGNIDISADGTTWTTQTLTTEWQRFSVTVSPTAGSKTPGVRIATSGDSIYIFGAQLSDSASVDPYVYNPVAAPSSVAYYGPRFDYDPVTLAPKGLLIEEQRTNLLLNSAVLNTQVVTTTATAHTLSFYGTGTIVLSGASTGTVVGTGAYPTRTTLTFTPIVGVLTVTVTGSVTMAQLEAGAFATSYIPTVASQVTRAADSASMIGNNFARWYNQTEGTLYSGFSQYSSTSPNNQWIATLTDGTTNNYIGSLTNPSSYRALIVSGGATQASIINGAVAANTATKTSLAYKVNDFAATSNGAVPVADTSGVVPIVSQLSIGSINNSNQLNGHISRIAYYNRRLSNTELQGITS